LGEARPSSQVRKLRSLRETLVSLHEMSDFTRRGVCACPPVACRPHYSGGFTPPPHSLSAVRAGGRHTVYELAADVCLRAHDFGEFLKCQQLLLHDIYPALEAQGALGGASGWTASRWAEFAATGVLYFPCVAPVCDSLEMTCTLRSIPSRLLATAPVQCAFRVVVTLLAGDYEAFLRLCVVTRPEFRRRRDSAARTQGRSVAPGMHSGERRRRARLGTR